jgi:hypothetical protein
MESSLDSVLNGQTTPEPTPEPQQVEQTQPEPQPTEEVTGEQPAGSPPEAKQDDPLDRHRKGLEQAAAAERKRRQDAEQRAQALEQELKSLRQPQAFPTQTEDPKPQRAQFETEDAWLDARDEWRDRQRETQWKQQEQARAEQSLKAKTEGIFAEAMKLPGFDMQAFVRLPCPQPMADAILDSDAAPQLVHWLTANPGEAYRIAALPDARQFKELARIEDRLAATPKEEPEPKEKPRLPETLTQARDVKGRFEGKAYDGPTPLSSILT